jgi:hypothetical protein
MPAFISYAIQYAISRTVGALGAVGNALLSAVRSAGVRSAMLDSFISDFGAAAGAVNEASGLPVGLGLTAGTAASVTSGAALVLFVAALALGTYWSARTGNPKAAVDPVSEEQLQAIRGAAPAGGVAGGGGQSGGGPIAATAPNDEWPKDPQVIHFLGHTGTIGYYLPGGNNLTIALEATGDDGMLGVFDPSDQLVYWENGAYAPLQVSAKPGIYTLRVYKGIGCCIYDGDGSRWFGRLADVTARIADIHSVSPSDSLKVLVKDNVTTSVMTHR